MAVKIHLLYINRDIPDVFCPTCAGMSEPFNPVFRRAVPPKIPGSTQKAEIAAYALERVQANAMLTIGAVISMTYAKLVLDKQAGATPESKRR